MGLAARALRRAAGVLVDALEGAIRIVIAVPRVALASLRVFRDLVRSRRALRGGALHCPIGHDVPTEAETYQCDACGYVYGGDRASIWVCGNPECGAITPFVDCPTCGLSCRNPYRLGA